MNRNIKKSQIKRNVIISLLAQMIALLVSFILNLIVPKFIDEYQYSYWQTYILYVGYVGILHFGLLDGIVLRYAQYDYEDLDKKRIRSQFQVLLIGNVFMSGLTIGASIFLFGQVFQAVAVFVAIGIVTKNVFTYTSYTFQITNRIDKYVIITIAQRIFFGCFVLILLIVGVKDFYWFCIADLVGDVFGTFLGSLFNRGMYFGPTIKIKEVVQETWANINTGILLLVANWSSMLLLGSAKMIVQWKWDTLVFGKVSFAFSVSSLFLVFINAISVVLFPSLKRMNQEELPDLYKKIRNILSPTLFAAMVIYFPGSWILQKWLPAYRVSLTYLGILLPIIVYTSKVSLLTNNYLKTYRQEKVMLMVNLISIVVALLLFLACAYLFENLTALLICIVFSIMLRSILSEIVIMKIIQRKFFIDFIIEMIMTVCFICSARLFNLWWGWLLYVIVLLIYLIYYRKDILRILRKKCKNI